MSPLNIGAWRDFPLRGRLESLTGLPVYGDGDAKALALAEGWLGAAKGVDNFIAMVVSTGVGGGIVALHPHRYAVAAWSPRLNTKGNSVMGMKALELLTTKLGSSIF